MSAQGQPSYVGESPQVTATLVSEFFEHLSDDRELRLPPAVVQQQKHLARM